MTNFSLIGKELGQALKVLSKSAKKGLPHNATCFDKFVINGKNEAGETVQREIINFKDAQGQILKRRMETKIQDDTFVQTRNYQNCTERYNKTAPLGGKSIFIHTNEYKNGKRLAEAQETISGMNDIGNKKIVTKTKIDRRFDPEGESIETHYIGKFRRKIEPDELQFSFNRDKNGFISSSLNVEKDLQYSQDKIDFSDEYLPTYLQTDKKSLAYDLVQIRMKKEGFGEMCDVMPYHKNIQDGKMTFGSSQSYTFSVNPKTGETDINFIKPKIKVLVDQPKLSMVDTASHEAQHLRQYGAIIDTEALEMMNENVRGFWQNSSIVKSGLAQSNAPILQKIQEAVMQGLETNAGKLKNEISKNEAHQKYLNNFMEVNARAKGKLVRKNYEEKIKNFRDHFLWADWIRILA